VGCTSGLVLPRKADAAVLKKGLDRLGLAARHDHHLPGGDHLQRRVHDVFDQGAASRPVQDLGLPRSHARPQARSQNDNRCLIHKIILAQGWAAPLPGRTGGTSTV